MRKTIMLVYLSVAAITAKAQYSGYTPLTDAAKFKENFTVASQKYQTIKSDFTQEKNLSMLTEKIISKGKFWFKKNNMVRLEYTQPYQYLMIINGKNIFIKDGKNENRISSHSNKMFNQINKITVDCVQGTVLNNTDFATKIFENRTEYLIELIPVAKEMKSLFKKIVVMIDKKDFSVTTMEMHELSGDYTQLRFSNKEFNTTVPDAIFSIK